MKIAILLGFLMVVSINLWSYKFNKVNYFQENCVIEEIPQYNDFKFKSADFEVFYNNFISDSIFQISRIKFPIKGCYVDYEQNKKWNKETWPMIKWDLREEIKRSDDSLFIEQTDNRFFFGSYCRDCGFSFEMTFEKIREEWFLTYRQENNY